MSLSYYGSLTKSLFGVWSYRASKENQLTVNALPFALNDMEIFPSASQVHEMLHCASECSKRNNKDFITFGEFCVFASELKNSYGKKIPKQNPLSRSRKDNRRSQNRLKNLNAIHNKPLPKYQVFLGGSCNPTTWRKDFAIPFLKSQAISSYNPQVAHWGPELIELENQAKQNAEVLFFVIDNQTRSVASMIEASHIAGNTWTKRKLILVINSFDSKGATIFGEPITDKELSELQQGQRYLRDLVEREGIPVFGGLTDALRSTAKVIREGITPQALTGQDAPPPVRMAHVQLAEKLFKLREVFDDLDLHNTGYITLEDVCMAFRIMTSLELTLTNLKSVVDTLQTNQGKPSNLNTSLKINLDHVRIDFDHFCCIMTEFSPDNDNLNAIASVASRILQVITTVAYPFSRLVDWFIHPEEQHCGESFPAPFSFVCHFRHVYLGGSSQNSKWREEIAVPMLKKQGLTCYLPQENGGWGERLTPLEISAIDRCKVLLFVITGENRTLSQMILAAHYIGKDCNVVLCIQYINDGAIFDGEKLSEQGIKDYNRGRVYLSDIATRNGIPVFNNISEAVQCAATKCLSSE